MEPCDQVPHTDIQHSCLTLGMRAQTPGLHSKSCQQQSRCSLPQWYARLLHDLALHTVLRAHLDNQRPLRQVISIFLAVGILFIPVGAVCLAEALSVRRDTIIL